MKQMKQSKFWMVYNPNGRAPTRPHYSKACAEDEAKRLAQANPAGVFFVLKAVSGFTAKPPEVSEVSLHRADDGIPF